MRDWPARRYPPTPYPPGSEATRQYRDAWDLGWQHVAMGGVQRAIVHDSWLTDGPERRGYRDGAEARAAYERRLVEGDRVWRKRWAREAREDERRRLGEEGAY
ncbi:hypothetical protein RB608_12045 [Nocardioides sp. LHD-245]|uniref:hypothetical protein n=1 Tax=Nocardioides sp. LHD-245 TaxID=3051387 RepID=UPI0027DF3BBE|nr:hypothetical protein [Nocardioides sp. LHD-245]